MTSKIQRPGFAFSARLKVRYAEIDGQKVVFNSRYLEYADVALTEYWEWADIAGRLGGELTHAVTGALHTIVTAVGVGVDLTTGRPLPHSPRVRAFLEGLIPPP